MSRLLSISYAKKRLPILDLLSAHTAHYHYILSTANITVMSRFLAKIDKKKKLLWPLIKSVLKIDINSNQMNYSEVQLLKYQSNIFGELV